MPTENFTLKIYDKTGKNVINSVTVDDENPSGSVDFGLLNNDAIKFSVSGIGLVQGSLTMQALDPYINSLRIVGKEQGGNGRELVQEFTASDFAVSGGKFNFFVPTDFEGDCIFSFKDLYSTYGDNTYYGNTGSTNHARYSLVMSPYWLENPDLYATDPEHVYTDKVYTDLAGMTSFKFNNADEVNAGTQAYYREYPFTLARYGGEDNFGEIRFTQEEMAGVPTKTAYLFTCDETRYNIAPTTATQHRYYAYYQMDVTMNKKTYNPVFNWTKVYDETCYAAGTTERNDAQWGLECLTEKENDQYGYLTVEQILNEINSKVGTDGYPETKDQILYVDGSQLLSIAASMSSNEQNNATLDKIKEGLSPNALVFLPKGTTSSSDNFAYKTIAGSFQSARNIVLTDKTPFYSPYDISTGGHYATYTRQVTVAANGVVNNATLILPFQLKTEDGVHKNTNDACTFKLHKMQATNCLSVDETNASLAKNYFGDLTRNESTVIETSQANVPYMVEVLTRSDSETSFVATQTGATIAKTTANTFEGETAEGKFGNAAYTFVNHGSFAGVKLDKTASSNGYFYFAKNMLLSTNNLQKPYLYVYPFRSYYSTTSSAGSNALRQMTIVFGKNENGDQTGIQSIEAVKENGAVYDLQGRRVENPTKGLYIVNGKKVMVK